jgi:hypothetical protein
MHFRCPLCLKQLDRDDRLAKFCPRHPKQNPGVFNAYDPDLPDGGFRCSARRCNRHQFVRPDGLLFQHLECKLEVRPGTWQTSINPFWNGSAIRVNEFLELTRKEVTTRVNHWLLDALAQAPNDNREMWFPAALLSRRGHRHHVLVSLTGAKKAGKTYLAMHAGYGGTYLGQPKPGEDYFFIHQGDQSAGHQAEFLLTLHLSQLLREDRHQTFDELIESTSVRPRNLKAMLFRDGPPSSSVPRILRPRVMKWVKDLYIDIKQKGELQGAEPETSFRGLLLYDLAGEAAESHSLDVLRHDEEMDVLAVLLSQEDLAGSGPTDGLRVARERLDDIRRARQAHPNHRRTALIISKCDTGAGPQEPRAMRNAAIAAARRLDEPGLASDIELAGTPSSALDRVFFTWRERRGRRNIVHGLEDFVRWCIQ